MTETVNASSGAYALGTFVVREQPSNAIMVASVLRGSHAVDTSMSLYGLSAGPVISPQAGLAVIGPMTSTFSAADAAMNEARFTLTTVVVDDVPASVTYTSNYETALTAADRVVERVEASMRLVYVLGSFTVTEQPSGQPSVGSLQGDHAVARGKPWEPHARRRGVDLVLDRCGRQCEHHLHGHG